MLRKIQPRLNSGTEGLSGQIIILIDRFVNNQPQHRTRFFAPWSSNSLQSCISSPSRTFRIAPHIIRPSFSETFGISFVRILTPSKVCGLPRSHSTSEIVGVFSGVSRSSINLFVFLAARGVHLLRLVLTGRHAEPGWKSLRVGPNEILLGRAQWTFEWGRVGSIPVIDFSSMKHTRKSWAFNIDNRNAPCGGNPLPPLDTLSIVARFSILRLDCFSFFTVPVDMFLIISETGWWVAHIGRKEESKREVKQRRDSREKPSKTVTCRKASRAQTSVTQRQCCNLCCILRGH